MMKKAILFVLCLILCALVAQAGPIDRQQAGQQAQAFFAQKGKTLKQSSKPYKAPRKGAAAEEAYYYVFNSDGTAHHHEVEPKFPVQRQLPAI